MVSATRGEATLSSLGVARRRARPPAHRRPRGALAPAAPAGGAGRRHRARRPDGPPGAPSSSAAASRATRACSWTACRSTSRAAPSTSAPPLPFELERVEVVRGAASSLYGTDALAGVVSLQTRRARAGREPVAARRGRGRLLRLAALPRRDVGRPRRLRLERGRAAADHRQRGAEQPLRADRGGALRGSQDRSPDGGARRRPLRRRHDGDAGADRLRTRPTSTRPSSARTSSSPPRCAAPRRASRSR